MVKRAGDFTGDFIDKLTACKEKVHSKLKDKKQVDLYDVFIEEEIFERDQIIRTHLYYIAKDIYPKINISCSIGSPAESS
jgi:hypothetical protein